MKVLSVPNMFIPGRLFAPCQGLRQLPANSVKPRELVLYPIPYWHAVSFLKTHHYLRSCPVCVTATLGVFTGQEDLVGVVVLTHPAARREDQEHTLELARMCLLDCCRKNSESRVLALIKKYVQTHYPHIKRLISYADAERHTGTIYRAAGWVCLGLRKTPPWTNRPGRTSSGGLRWKFEMVFKSRKEDDSIGG